MTKAINTNFKLLEETYTATLEKNNNTQTFTLVNNDTNGLQQVSGDYNIDTWNMLSDLYSLEETV
jgi:hypothetical protein